MQINGDISNIPNLRLTQSSPFPEGGYVITNTVTDAPSGKSFKIVKDILIRQ